MRRYRIAMAVLATLWAGLSIPAGQSGVTDTTSRDAAALTLPTPARLAIWTDKLGYLRWHDTIRVYLAVDPMADGRPFRTFIYLENIETRRRQYLVREGFRAASAGRNRRRSRRRAEATRRSVPLFSAADQDLEPEGAGTGSLAIRCRVAQPGHDRDREKGAREVRCVRPGSPGHRVWRARHGDLRRHDVDQRQDLRRPGPGVRQCGRDAEGRARDADPGPRAECVHRRRTGRQDRGARSSGRADRDDLRRSGRAAIRGLLGRVARPGQRPHRARHEPGGGCHPGDATGLRGPRSPGFERSAAIRAGRVRRSGHPFRGRARRPGFLRCRVRHADRPCPGRAIAGDGILFSGGTANCMYCVSSGSRDDELAWVLGWQGTAQHVFLQQSPAGGDCGIEGANDELGFGTLPRSAPRLYNLTLIGSSPRGLWYGAHGGGILLRAGSAVTARNALVMGFPSGAIDARDDSPSLFIDGTSSIENAILHDNAGSTGGSQVNGGVRALVGFRDEEPMLVNVRYQAGLDPRPMLGSPALRVGAGAVPPSDGVLDTSAEYIGAFGDSNWLEEWTVFGPEQEYDTPGTDGAGERQ